MKSKIAVEWLGPLLSVNGSLLLRFRCRDRRLPCFPHSHETISGIVPQIILTITFTGYRVYTAKKAGTRRYLT